MKKLTFLLLTLFILSSHDMFLKMPAYYLQPNSEATIDLYNGTFTTSENTIDRNRMVDVSLVGNGNRNRVDTSQWTENGGTTVLNFTTGEPGTWVAGVSTFARNIELSAKDFNEYLEHDGVMDMMQWRKDNNALEQDAIEKYSKHVKAIFQVGETMTNDWKTKLGYPIEFVPLSNPYEARKGDQLKVQLWSNGQPLADHLVYVGSEHSHGGDHSHDDTDDDHQHTDATQLLTDNQGIVTMDITDEGIWYLRTIHMILSQEEGLTHESNWATLTFEIGHGHSHADGHSHGLPSWAYYFIIVGLLLAILVWLRMKGNARRRK